MKTWIFNLAVATLLAHELDAVKHSEWGVLYVLRDLPASQAYFAFVLLHVPLILVILWLSYHSNLSIKAGFRLFVSGFVVVHGLIHFSLIGSDRYMFDGWLSDGLIFSSAMFGLVYLGVSLVARMQSLPES